MENNVFTLLEKDVMKLILAGDDPVLETLRQQFSSSTVESRENTVVGMYLNFNVPKDVKAVHEIPGVKSKFCFGDVGAVIGSQQQEVGFLLWIIDGRLAFLEGYSYGDDKWPEIIEEFNLSYFGDKHDLDELRKSWTL